MEKIVNQAIGRPDRVGNPPREHRVFGPPGTGKTTYLAGQVRHAAATYGPEGIVVASFTRAAALEIGGRGIPVPRDHVGTLHRLAYRALGRPPLADGKDLVGQWNAAAGEGEKVGEVDVDELEQADPDQDARKIYQAYNRLRGQMVPRDRWRGPVVEFARRWEAFKADTGSIDFTDMIEQALTRRLGLPRTARVGFFDEVQDCSPLELALIRSWDEQLERIVLAGDDDQAIYFFRGASPQAFLHPAIPDEQKRVLNYSWRLPARVKAYADAWIKHVAAREPKPFRARADELGRAVDGHVEFGLASLDWPSSVASLAEQFARSGTVMVLATCGYMLDGVVRELRQGGVPFHNPYRRSNGKWNPMRGWVDRVLSLLRPDRATWGDDAREWTWGELHRWLELVDADHAHLRRGAKAFVKQKSDSINIKAEQVPAGFLEEIIFDDTDDGRGGAAMARGDPLEFLRLYALDTRRHLVEYALDLAARGRLREKPRIIVGTIHSVKGAEADSVIVSPDLSASAWEQWDGGVGSTREDADAVRRTFYVAFTRARERLVLCDPSRPRGWDRRVRSVEF